MNRPASIPDPPDALGPPTSVELSIIIPAYRQGERIRQDITDVQSVLKTLSLLYEIIVVVDGSGDDTLSHANDCASANVRVFGYAVNRGKGYAVRFGFRQASGKIVGFIDAGGDINPLGIATAVRVLLETGADVTVGSKRHPMSHVRYPTLRRLYSFAYQKLVKILFDFDLKDTQTGLKVFRRDVVIAALPHMTIDRFAFDVELLAIIRRLGFRIFTESPVDVRLIFPSSIGGIRPIIRMLADTVSTAWRLHRLRSS